MVWTELHQLCASSSHTAQHEATLLNYLEYHEEEASMEHDDGSLPLHHFLVHNPPLRLVKPLVEAYPDATSTYESIQGYYPLHVAIRSGCSPDVIEYLIQGNPAILDLRTQRFFLCCLQEFFLLWRGIGLAGFTCKELAEKLPMDNPNRKAIMKLLSDYSNR